MDPNACCSTQPSSSPTTTGICTCSTSTCTCANVPHPKYAIEFRKVFYFTSKLDSLERPNTLCEQQRSAPFKSPSILINTCPSIPLLGLASYCIITCGQMNRTNLLSALNNISLSFEISCAGRSDSIPNTPSIRGNEENSRFQKLGRGLCVRNA